MSLKDFTKAIQERNLPGKNKPLTREEVKALPVIKQQLVPDGRGGLKLQTDFNGFTCTALFPTNAERRPGKSLRPNNRKVTPGRQMMHVDKMHIRQTKFGPVMERTGSTKKVYLKNKNIKNQFYLYFDRQ